MKCKLLFFIIFSSLASMAHAKELSVGWELWYPYQYHNSQNELVGLDIESFDAIMRQAGLPYHSAEIPWKTHLHFIKTGKVDIAMGASRTEDRENYAYFTKPYRLETVKLFVKNGQAQNIKLNTLADLSNSPYLIGVEGGYYYGKEYQELIKRSDFKANISEVIDIEQNVTLLLEGNLDGFLVDPITMKAFVKKYNMQGLFEQHAVEIYSADIYIMLSKESSDESLVKKINQSIKTLKDNGTLQAINRSWSQLQKSD